MGVEVKGASEGVVIADRGSDCCNNHSGKTRRLPALIE